MNGRQWILYDGRAVAGRGTDDAQVLVCCDSDREARSYAGDFGSEMACYSYRIVGDQLVDERHEWDWFDGPGFS